MKKKIIYVTKALWIGGIETALVNLLKHFNYEDYEVTLLVLHAELNMLEQIPDSCKVIVVDRERAVSFEDRYKYTRLYHLTEKSEHPSKFHTAMMWSVPVIRWIENQCYISYVKKHLETEKYDTCIIYSDVVAEIAIKAVKADKYLMVYHHGAMRHVYHDKIAYRKCEKIIAVSENQALALREFVPGAAEKIVTIHNLTDVDGILAKSSEKVSEIFEKEVTHIVSVGRVSYEKGMDLAIAACQELVLRGNTGIHWWIVGDGPDMENVKSVLRKAGMEEYVTLLGMKNNPYPYIAQADLYVQPSRFESFGLTIMEALILGKKVIATNTMGASEILKSSSQGVLCDVDSGEIAKVIETVISSDTYTYTQIDNSIFKKENQLQMQKLENLI